MHGFFHHGVLQKLPVRRIVKIEVGNIRPQRQTALTLQKMGKLRPATRRRHLPVPLRNQTRRRSVDELPRVCARPVQKILHATFRYGPCNNSAHLSTDRLYKLNSQVGFFLVQYERHFHLLSPPPGAP
jgi:hypothetical protein